MCLDYLDNTIAFHVQITYTSRVSSRVNGNSLIALKVHFSSSSPL